jgi:hypothetical protein
VSRGKVVLDGKEYEIVEVGNSDGMDGGGRVVELFLTPVIGENDREVFKVDVAESITEFNIGSMEKGSAGMVIDCREHGDVAVGLVDEIRAMDPGTAIVIVRRKP